jgi:hypothetical protein
MEQLSEEDRLTFALFNERVDHAEAAAKAARTHRDLFKQYLAAKYRFEPGDSFHGTTGLIVRRSDQKEGSDVGPK